MNQKELKKLRRSDLFKLLVEQANKIEQQQSEIDALEMQLQDRKLTIENAGSIAEASLALNKVFETAQLAADLYMLRAYDQIVEAIARETFDSKPARLWDVRATYQLARIKAQLMIEKAEHGLAH